MDTRRSDVMFTGGAPGESVEEIFRMFAGAVGNRALAYPDGEIGERWGFVTNLNHNTWPKANGVEQRVNQRVEERVQNDTDGEFDVETGEHHFHEFFLADGVTELDLRGLLPYSRAALESYEIFSRLRDEGVIAPGVRFQMSLPAAYDAVVPFFPNPDDWPVVMAGWTAALQDEYARMLAVIPADDLVIQIDYSMELVEATGIMRELLPWVPTDETPAEVLVRYSSKEYVAPHVAGLPDEVVVGWHICAGTFPEYPVARLPDISVPVTAANAIVANAGRRIDFVHLPAVKESDEAYFAPLADLKVGDTRVFLGLECNDGPDEMKRRINAASTYLKGFGVAHYCGYMWNKEIMPRLLQDLNTGADQLAALA